MSSSVSISNLGISNERFIEILQNHHIVIDGSPVLGDFDSEGEYGDALEFSWEADAPCDAGFISIPHKNIPNAVVYADTAIWVKDIDGEEVMISLYPMTPVSITDLV